MQPITVEGEVQEGADFSNVGLVLRPSSTGGRTQLLQADVTGWALTVHEKGNPAAIYTDSGLVTDTNPDEGTAILVDTLTGANDGFWGLDADGANFRHYIAQTDIAAASANLEGGKRYKFVYRLTTSSYGVVPLVFVVKIEPNPAA